MLYYIILALIVLICILLVIVILLQPGQGSGLAGGLAGGSLASGGGQGLGARRTADLLSKSTTVLGTALLVLCVAANFAIDTGGQTESTIQESGVEQPAEQEGGETPSAVPEIPGGDDGGSDDGEGN